MKTSSKVLLKKFNDSILSRLNYRIVSNDRLFPVDLTGADYNPIEAAYFAEGRSFITRVPLGKCSIMHSAAFVCDCETDNPLIATLREYQKGKCDCFRNAPIRKFYGFWQPGNASEVLGLNSDKLSEIPPLGFVFPWESALPEQKQRYLKTAIKRDSSQFNESITLQDGWKGWGPVSDKVGELEFQRLLNVYFSIKEHGYIRSDEYDGDMVGKLLSRDGLYRVMIMPGHHRAAALAALGYDEATVRFHHPVIRREDYLFWPHVRTGLYTEKKALQVFDRIFEGRQPWKEN